MGLSELWQQGSDVRGCWRKCTVAFSVIVSANDAAFWISFSELTYKESA